MPVARRPLAEIGAATRDCRRRSAWPAPRTPVRTTAPAAVKKLSPRSVARSSPYTRPPVCRPRAVAVHRYGPQKRLQRSRRSEEVCRGQKNTGCASCGPRRSALGGVAATGRGKRQKFESALREAGAGRAPGYCPVCAGVLANALVGSIHARVSHRPPRPKRSGRRNGNAPRPRSALRRIGGQARAPPPNSRPPLTGTGGPRAARPSRRSCRRAARPASWCRRPPCRAAGVSVCRLSCARPCRPPRV